MNVNKATIIGRLTRDPEVRKTQSGQDVTSFSLATNRKWKNKDGSDQDETEFHNITAWGKLAEIAGKWLVKGQECYVEGRLHTQTYTDKQGVEKKSTEIVMDSMQMGSKAGESTQKVQEAAAENLGAEPVEGDSF